MFAKDIEIFLKNKKIKSVSIVANEYKYLSEYEK